MKCLRRRVKITDGKRSWWLWVLLWLRGPIDETPCVSLTAVKEARRRRSSKRGH